MRLFIMIFILSFSHNSLCEGIANLYEVDFVRVDSTGKGYVKFKTALTSSPAACIQSGYESTLAFDTNQSGGKSILSVALAAQASGKKILAKGSGNCTVYGVMEDWNWGYIQ